MSPGFCHHSTGNSEIAFHRFATDSHKELLHSLNRAICVASPPEGWEEHRKAVFQTLIGCVQSFIVLLLDETLAEEQGWIQGLVPSCCVSILGIFCYADEHEELAWLGKTTLGSPCRQKAELAAPI